jgi:DNA-3-methyladenine glycosylase II
VIPAADIGVQNAVKALYDLPERPNEAELRDMALAWSPWRSYATYYLWNSLIKPS